MFVPPYDAILHAIGTSRNDLADAAEVKIPVSLLKFLLKFVVSSGDFNEAGYLAANPDIAEAIRTGAMTDAAAHYANHGYFEGRRGATPQVDEAWYRKTYPDVAVAIRVGHLASGQEHFDVIGAEEFRTPSRTSEKEVYDWKKAVGKAAS
jgi:hypothetical protein